MVYGEQLNNAWVGGLNSPQFATMQIGGDAGPELVVFDKVGHFFMGFSRSGDGWKYNPDLTQNFPDIREWVVFRDFNADGAMDVFAFSDAPGISGMSVYKGYFESGQLLFERFTFPNSYNLVQYLRNGGQTQLLYVTNIDYPVIDDLDCDGDLDIATFNAAGGLLELFANQSVESGFGLDSLVFRYTNGCWGGIFESGATEVIDLAVVSGDCAYNLSSSDTFLEFRHTGSALNALDLNNDGLKELFISDISFNNISVLWNEGNCEEAWFQRQETFFPEMDTPVNLPSFPAAFICDVNLDGNTDVLAAPNLSLGGKDFDNVWFYENIGTEEVPQYHLRQENWLVGEMLDLGTGAHPVLVDVDADGLTDLVVGNMGFYQEDYQRDSRLFYFRNTGTLIQPAFTLMDDDYLGLSRYRGLSFNFVPNFGDFDGDQDLDILVGEENGSLFYAENLAGPGRPLEFDDWVYPFAGIDVGNSSAPFMVDINGDGLTDLLVGERNNGNINYFQQLGAGSDKLFEPNQSLSPNLEKFGGIDTRIPGYINGFSAPLVFESDGARYLLTGTDNGKLELYEIPVEDFTAVFPLVSEKWGDIYTGTRSKAALGDLDNDGLLELVIGNYRGGLGVFATRTAGKLVTSSYEREGISRLSVFPNPMSEYLNFNSPEDGLLEVFDLQGKIILQTIVKKGWQQISLAEETPGTYWLRLKESTGSSYAARVVKL